MARSPQSREGRGGGSKFTISASLNQTQLDALRRGLKAAGHEASNALRHELKGAGQIIQQEIQGRTPVGHGYKRSRGRRPGRLKRSTKVRTFRSLSVKVYNDAKAVSRRYPGGYRYGKRLEFDPKFAGRYAFFYPGYEAARERAMAAFNAVLEAAHRAFIKGG